MSDDHRQQGISRRGFLKGAAIGAGALALAGWTPSLASALPAEAVPRRWDDEADLVIIGGGGAGLVAAIQARELGATVLVLEKSARCGGTTSVSGGLIQASATPYQREAGILGDNPETHYRFWLEQSEGIADPDLVRVLAEEAPRSIQWLADRGVKFTSVTPLGRIPFVDPELNQPRIHAVEGGGMGLMRTIEDVAEARGAQIRTNTSVVALVTDEEKGVIGVKAESRKGTLFIRAARAVILATSSFDHNREMSRAFSPQQLWALEKGRCLCVATNDGEGIRMAMGVGADLAGMGGTIGFPGVNVGRSEEVPGIWVNKLGQRFVDEAAHYAYVMRAVFDQPRNEAWAIFDDEVKALGGRQIGGVFQSWSDDLSEEIAAGVAHRGATIEELARSLGIPAQHLAATVKVWNEDAARGVDSLCGREIALKPITKAPYYAVPVTEVNLGSMGGVKINTKGQVLDLHGQPIPRLYAGGMVAGGFLGPYYPGSGTAIQVAMTFGRIAAENAAREPAIA